MQTDVAPIVLASGANVKQNYDKTFTRYASAIRLAERVDYGCSGDHCGVPLGGAKKVEINKDTTVIAPAV